ncbi:MAG: DUF1460 domain-containing protein [Deltaproteobacteria bacterium]|nr:DUF1460 domain-containing protein [Deltaproteobacteria bacterium]
MTVAQIDVFLSEVSKNSKNQVARMLKVSEKFLGAAFSNSPLGEGPGSQPDPDPLIRFDSVDCTTLIEQTLALSQSVNLKEAMELLRRIRYIDGEIGYVTRKHFMMAQWIPLNQQLGLLEDITREIGGNKVKLVKKRLNTVVWKKRNKKKAWPLLKPDQIPQGQFHLPIILIDEAPKYVNQIPAGTILNVVRRDYRSMPVRITHQGLVIVKNKRRYLRHAARAGYRRVVDELLLTFLRRNKAYSKWPVDGINLQRVTMIGGKQK